jgi:hypothetical protein
MAPKKSPEKKTAPPPAPDAAAAVPEAAPASNLPPALTNPDTVVAYKALYEILGRAYWEASDLTAKDTIQGARDSIYEILTDLNIARLEANTGLFLALKARIEESNKALGEIKEKINSITKNISTASSVIAAIAKVLSVAPALL